MVSQFFCKTYRRITSYPGSSLLFCTGSRLHMYVQVHDQNPPSHRKNDLIYQAKFWCCKHELAVVFKIPRFTCSAYSFVPSSCPAFHHQQVTESWAGAGNKTMLCTQVEPYIDVGTWEREPGACAPPSFQKLLYKLLVTLCVVTKCAQKVFPTPLSYCIQQTEGI